MKNSKEIISKAGIIPKLRLGTKTDKGVQSNGPRRVKFITDKEVKEIDNSGKEVEKVAYLVEENGEKKSYRVNKFGKDGEVHYLVKRLAEIEEGQEVILEMKKRGLKNYIEVIPVVGSKEVEIQDDELEEDDEKGPTEEQLKEAFGQ